MQSYLKALLQFRKNSETIHKGKTVHFAPKEGIYLMFRVLNDETVVLILNKNDKEVELDLARFKEMVLDGREMTDIITGENLIWKDKLVLKEKGATVLKTK
ncbi:cyclomaltodextrinase C-terminal domain-containing protein [Lutimonas zeaxanthinifaciens]|uniref:cyclomaltodextrinase C-terminal domain-containing protein n=1 Tax=Lutimonas zeaxanthinifaciens TaxID=3060215 RepID=UPI003D168043